MEPGGSSSAVKPVEEVWAKLVPLDSRYSDVEIRSNEMVICSEIASSSVKKQEWCKITRSLDPGSATVENMSSYMIIADGAMLEKGDSTIIKCGTEVVSGPTKEGYLTYKFEVKPISKHSKKELKIPVNVEHAKCYFCLNIWRDVVTIAPCQHNFCNGCFSEWLRRSHAKNQNVLCPQCQAVVHSVGRNHFLCSMAEDILENDPSLRRSKEEVALLDASALVNSNLVIRAGKTPCRKRMHRPPDEESNAELSCLQCGTELGGFQCNEATSHLQCQACGGTMPSRVDISIPQHCLGCGGAFCGVYWHTQGVVTSVSNPVCSRESFKPISERTPVRIPVCTHQNNQYEKDVTSWCIRQMEKTLQDVISDWVVKFNNREIDRTRIPLNHAEMITSETHLCNACYDELVSFLLYWFRISTPKPFLPPEASERENCWYGYACHTQHNNEEHARKRNHVCCATRGNDV